MTALKLTEQEAQFVFRNLFREYRIIAPVEKNGGGRLSGTNLLAYDEVKGIDEIDFSGKTYYSAKSALLPIRETLFEFKDGSTEEAEGGLLPTLLFLRACDIHAFSVLDTHFLENGGCRDRYYESRRRSTKFFLMECAQAFNNCFCASMGTNCTSDYAAFVRKTEGGYEVKIQDREMEEYFSVGEEAKVEPRFVKNDPEPLDLPDEIDVSLFDAEMWKEYSARCSACGRCNVSCPTCTCFTVQDLPVEAPGVAGERRRIWSSCQVKSFGLLAGGHDFRIPKGDRMRYKVLHKIYDFRKRTGLSMCVGCGRCDNVCPEYISMFNCVKKINYISSLSSTPDQA